MSSITIRSLLSKTSTCPQVGARHLSTSPLRYSGRLPRVPLYIGGKAIDTSSGGTVTHYHAKTGKESCEVVMAGEEETSASHRFDGNIADGIY